MTVHIGYELKNWYMHNHTPTHNTPQPHPQRAQPKVETPCLQADSPTSTQSCVSPDLPMGSGPVGVKDQPFHEEDLGLPWDSGSLDRRVRLASLIPEAREPYRRKPESACRQVGACACWQSLHSKVRLSRLSCQLTQFVYRRLEMVHTRTCILPHQASMLTLCVASHRQDEVCCLCVQVEVKLVSVEADQLPLDFKTTFQRHMRLW